MLLPERHLLLRDEKPVRIGGRALDLLTALVERRGELVTKGELIAQVWPDTTVDESNLKVNMSALRRVLEDGPNTPQYIATVVGRGYRFVAPVESVGLVEAPIEASPPSTPSHNLPISTTRIFGRNDAIAALGRDLEQSRLVSIVGPGGIGKTTVALAVAEAAIEAFGDGVWVVDLAPLSDGNRTPNAIAAVFGLQAHSADMLTVVCEHLRRRQTLLVLDNCEHVIDGVASCADRILAIAAGVKLLLTSREPLRIARERVRKLSGLDAPPEESLLDASSALTFPAVQLFVERATDAHGPFRLSDADAPIVGQICRKLDGLALAIELAATRVGTFGVTGLLRQLDDRFRLLTGWRTGPERHRTLAATLDWSYELLDEREAALLRAVSVFPGAFGLEGAAAVSAGSTGDVLDTLISLSTKSLLAIEPQDDRIRCRLLETTREYSTFRLRSSGDEQAIRMRHAEYVCAVLDKAKAEWARHSASEWRAAYGPLVDDLRAALAWAGLELDRDGANRSLLVRLTVAGTLLWSDLSLTQESRAHVSRALEELEAAGLAGTATEMQLGMSLAASTMWTRGLIPEVLTTLQRTREIAIRIGDVEHHLRCLRLMGSFQSLSGDLESAVATHTTFATIATEHDPSALPDGATHLGIAELHLGRLKSSLLRLERLHQQHQIRMVGLDGSRLSRFLYDRGVDIGNVLSYAQWLTGLPDSAARTAEATVEQGLKTKHGLSLSNALAVAACPVFFFSRRYDECRRYSAMLDEEVKRHGILMWSPTARFFRGALACAQDDVPARGLYDLEQAVAEYRAINHAARRSWILAVLADAYARSGRLAEATTTIADALDWARSHSEGWCMPEVLRIQASILIIEGRIHEAETVLVDAIAVAEEIGGRSWKLRAANDLARLLRARSRMDEARELLRPIYSAFTEGFATHDLLVAADLLAASDGPTRMPSG